MIDRGPLLVCTQGMLEGQRFVITVDGLRIGREPGNEIHIDDSGISRQHARVLLHNGAVWVQDAGSRNGIFVNDQRVPDHKQIKVGDRLTFGGHAFEVAEESAAPAPRASDPRPAAPAAARAEASPAGWKVWPFVVAVLLALGFISCIGLLGALREDDAAAVQPPPAYSLSTLLETSAGAPVAPGPAPTIEQALAVVAGPAVGTPLPVPPPGTTSRELADLAQGMYDSGRLADARTQYRLALQLDPACAICTLRIERISAELAQQVQQQFDLGMRAFDSRQFAEARSAWETVLMLVPDASDPMHVQAADYLAKANAASAARP